MAEQPLPRAEDVHLIACDVDGTLLSSKHVMHERTVQALKHIRKTRSELPIVISSGKQFCSCLHLRQELDLHPFPASHAHGSVIYETDDKIIDIVHLEPQIVLSLVEELHSANRATFLFDEQECLLINEEKDGPDWLNIAKKYDTNVKSAIQEREEVLRSVGNGEMKVIKVTVCADPKGVEEYIETLASKYPTLGITRAIPFILEVHDPHTNKGTALRKICQHLNLSTKNALVFGDGENDIAMFREAGWSVAMANGMALAKEAATYQTLSNDEGGVGAFLDRIFRPEA